MKEKRKEKKKIIIIIKDKKNKHVPAARAELSQSLTAHEPAAAARLCIMDFSFAIGGVVLAGQLFTLCYNTRTLKSHRRVCCGRQW